MKHLKLFFALFAMLALGVGNAWAETIVLKAEDGFSSSYQSDDKTFTKSEITFGYLRTQYNANATPTGWYKQQLMQLSKNASTTVGGDIWNVTSVNIAKITVKLAVNNNDFTLFYGTSAKPSTNSIAKSDASSSTETITYSGYSNKTEQPGQTTTINVFTFDLSNKGATHFLIDNGSKVNYIWEIIIETSDGSEEPTDCTPLTPTLSYESTTLLTSTTSSAPTLDGNTGEGTVTYTSSNTEVATVDAETGVITAVNAGTTTITATIAATGEYCEGKTTANITVQPLVSCADIYNLADDATFVLKDFVVTYVNGKYTYIKDNEGGYGLIFTNSGEYGLKAGEQVASGKFEGKKDTYNGLVEIIPTTEVGDLGATSGTAPDPEVMNTNPTEDDMNKYVKFEDVTFASTGFSNKKVTGKINAGDITFYDQFATSATFNTSKKYNVIGAVSIYNSTVQVNFISAEEVAEPTLNLTTTPIDFGKVAINSTNESTLQLSGSLLTKDITLSVEGDSYFTVSANSITPSEGSVNETITITYKPTVEGTHTATLKITSDELTEQTITLTGNAVEEYTVHFYVNGEEQTELAKTILSGNTLDALPEEPESCDPLTYPTFAGWTTAEIVGTTDTKPTMLDLSTPITSDCNYYAVFEKATVGDSSEEQTETITIENFKSSGDGDARACETTSATWTWLKNNASSPINVTYEEIRLYGKHTMTISPKAGCEISKIVVDINTGKPASDFADGGLSGASMSLEGNTATLTPTSGDIVITQTDQSRVNSFVVTYTAAAITYEYITSCESAVPTCKINYSFDGGEGNCTNDIVEKGSAYTLCENIPTKTGYTFLKWKDQNGAEYEAGATITVSEDLTLAAQWQINSYTVTWISLGTQVASNSVEYNTQPTKPATNPTYTCGTDKEFVGWTTKEIEGVGNPEDLYTTAFPVVTEAVNYYAVFASANTSTESTTHTLTPNESWSGYQEGSIKDDQNHTWSYCAAGTNSNGIYSLNLRNRDTEISYIGSPLFTANVKNIKATIVNGSSSKNRNVYICSAPQYQPTTGDLGVVEVPASNNGEVELTFTGTINQFYLQVSDALQFQSIVVEVGAAPYANYVTSCEGQEPEENKATVTITDASEATLNQEGFFTGAGEYNINEDVTVTATAPEEWTFAYWMIGEEIVSYDAQYTFTVTGDTELKAYFAMNMTVTINNMVIDWDNEVLTGSDMFGIEVVLGIGNETEDGTNALKEGSQVFFNGSEMIIKNGYLYDLNVWDSPASTSAYILAAFGEELYAFTINMVAAAAEPVEVVVTNATAEYDAVNGALTFKGLWNGENVSLEIAGYEGKESIEYYTPQGILFETVDAFTFADEASITVEGKTITVECVTATWDNSVIYDITFTGTLVEAIELSDGDNSSVLALDGQTVNVLINRSMESGQLYTIALPFAIDNTTVINIFGSRVELYEFTSLVQDNTGELVLSFTKQTAPAIEAGKPYLIKHYKSSLEEGFTVSNVTISATENPIQHTANGNTITMKPILSAEANAVTDDKTWWLAADGYLHSNETPILSLRALFNVVTPSGIAPRMRVVTGENEATGLDNITSGENTAIKVIENGQLIIIREGVKYNVQGVRL